MSHDAPIYGYEWFQKAENALKEMRVGYDLTVMRDTANGFFQNVMTFVSDHQSELLYSVSGVSLGIMALYLLWKWTNAENALQSLSEDIKGLERRLLNTQEMLQKSRKSLVSYQNKLIDMDDELEQARSDYNEMETSRDYWQEKVSEVMAERNQMEEERDDLESDRADMESERDWWQEKLEDKASEYEELEEKVETLEAMVDTYKTLVSEMESTTELRLAA